MSINLYIYLSISFYLSVELFICKLLRLVGKERANLSAIVYLIYMWFLFGEVSSSSWCLGWVAYFIVALPGLSI